MNRIRSMNRLVGRSRRATTSLETVVAIALLGVAVSALGNMLGRIQHGLNDRELATRVSWEIDNARERIGSWAVDQITPDRIEELPISEALQDRVENLKWQSEVTPITDPIQGVRVRIDLTFDYRGQAVAPNGRTFWVSKEQAE